MDAIASAVADSNRRRILLMLRDRPLTAGDIAGAFEISRPAISRHLRVLRESGVVAHQARGRERIYSLEPAPLRELQEWLGALTRPWEARLDALDTEIRRARRDRRAAPASTATTRKEQSA